MTITPDPDYEFVPPIKRWPETTRIFRGRQCGECGMKFEYDKAYGYCCPRVACPMGWSHWQRDMAWAEPNDLP